MQLCNKEAPKEEAEVEKEDGKTSVLAQAEDSSCTEIGSGRDLGQTGGKISVNSIPAQERRPKPTAPLASSHSISSWKSLYDTCKFAVNCHRSERIMGGTSEFHCCGASSPRNPSR